MGSNQIRRTGADPAAKADGKGTGQTVDAGPYEAIVVKHVEGTRSGQMLVYIPDFGGDKSNPNDQILVSYASPFFGTTAGTDDQSSDPNANNAQWTTGMSYGFWFIPPDINNKVLVTFAAGDRNRGYWFACIYDSPTHHMVPAIGRNVGGPAKTLPPKPGTQLNPALEARGTSYSPVVEGYSGNKENTKDTKTVDENPRYVHEYQNLMLVAEGLDGDPIRGAISSSSLREAPSNVYGISTPGPKIGSKSKQKEVNGADGGQAVFARYGGHTFVMDDGDSKGNNRLMRLRTTNGHQILMSDSSDILYIASASGKQWIEFSHDGSMNVYAKNGFNVRTNGDLNLHSETNININSNGMLKMHGDQGVKITTRQNFSAEAMQDAKVVANNSLKLSSQGPGLISVGAELKIGGQGDVTFDGPSVSMNSSSIPETLTASVDSQSLPDVEFSGVIWEPNGSLDTICTVAPCHEPWPGNTVTRVKS